MTSAMIADSSGEQRSVLRQELRGEREGTRGPERAPRFIYHEMTGKIQTKPDYARSASTSNVVLSCGRERETCKYISFCAFLATERGNAMIFCASYIEKNREDETSVQQWGMKPRRVVE